MNKKRENMNKNKIIRLEIILKNIIVIDKIQ